MGTDSGANLSKTGSNRWKIAHLFERDRLPQTTAPQSGDCGVAEYLVGVRFVAVLIRTAVAG